MSEFPLIRAAVTDDASGIAQIYSESILARDSTMDTEPVSEADILLLLESLTKREAVFVILTESGLQGWGIVKEYSDRPGYAVACETSVYLFRESLRQGLGKLLQSRLLEFAQSAAYHHVVTKIWADNDSSIAFHRSCGFTLVGVQKEVGRVDGVWRDVAIMQCLLDKENS
ncbi:MAG: GNAT family N-acetyltransferase [Rhodothermia bacterium]|nr:MAG: GNAT family N-acetyltransferase [Rhodothermia bacterium]